MPTHLYLAPAAAGKTTWVLQHARRAALDLAATPRIIVPTHLQVRAARARLAALGGAIGVRVLTFDRLYAEILNSTGDVFVELSEPVQYRLIRAIVDTLPLHFYAPLTHRPGFIQVVQRLIAELKAAGIDPTAFTRAVDATGSEPRLAELAHIYTAYQDRLQTQAWADRAGLGWLAVEALTTRTSDVARDWPLLAVDGFATFTPIQIALLAALATRVGELVITLTGEHDTQPARLAQRRFDRTRSTLETALHVRAAPLPAAPAQSTAPALAHLAQHLFVPAPATIDAAGAVDLIEAPDRAGEVRAALRWLKQRLVLDGCQPGEIALLARHTAPYRPFIQQTATEFGLPIRLVDGPPLANNPAVVALFGLLGSALPLDDTHEQLTLRRQDVVEAWGSPYFDWSLLPGGGIRAGDADTLDAVARWGRVIGGLAQWREAFDHLVDLSENQAEDDDRGIPSTLPRGEEARSLRTRFEDFVAYLTPPRDAASYRAFVGWLEALIGEDDKPNPWESHTAEHSTSLQVVAQARAADATAERDVAALASLKDVLRGLVWAEEVLPERAPVDYTRFVTELAAAVDAVTYNLPVRADRGEILVVDVIQARGLPWRAVAVLGLAEGEFPATLGEDPFLRDADRRRLQAAPFHLPLELSVSGSEAEFFYETITRPRERLLLTRSRLADNGAPWPASPYWEAIRQLLHVEPVRLTSEHAPPPAAAASWPELLQSLATHAGMAAVRTWAQAADPPRMAALAAAVTVLGQRTTGATSPFDGDLSHFAESFRNQLGPDYTWSPSRLETYRRCPFSFFVTYVLHLEPRSEPVEGLDVRALGNIYHRIFEQLYRQTGNTTDTALLLAALPAVARAVLDAAPQEEGFRVTAWWQQSRAAIEANVQHSLEVLAQRAGEYVPLFQEKRFTGDNRLTIQDGTDSFAVQGIIDRIDRTPDGRLRIIDYKTAGPTTFTVHALEEGKKLQLPLYALAAEQALGLGTVADGFYWHVQHAEASALKLVDFDGGPAAAIDAARDYAWKAVRGARDGHFAPQPPSDGCPDYCPAVAFCWRYRPRR